jgi:hypothetical protein
MESSDFLKSLGRLEEMAKGMPIKGVSQEVRKVDRGGDPYRLWEQACKIFTNEFIETGKHYGAPLYAHMRIDMYHELAYAMRRLGPPTGSLIYRLPCDTSLRLVSEDNILPIPGYPQLPDNAVAISDPNGYGLICVFDFGFCISDVCIHDSVESIQGFLKHKGLGEYSEQAAQLGRLFGDRAKDADWNF